MAIDWTEIPNNQKDMYERWIKFSVGNLNAEIRQANKYKNPSVPSDCVYQYDSANNRVYNTINTESLVGIVSPDSRSDHYIFDGQLKTFSTGDNDPIGFVIAYVKMPNGDVHTLTAMRTTFGKPSNSDQYGFWLGAPLTIVKDYLTHAPYLVAEGFGGLKYYNGRIPTADNKFVPAAEHNPATNWMSFAPNGFRIRVTRVRDIITVETSQLNETTLVPGAKITVNLADHPELEIFRARCHYGFCSVSQDRVYWGGTIKHPTLRTPFWLSDVHDNYGTKGWMTNAAEAGGIWKRDPVDMKEVFNTWKRISRGCWSDANKCSAAGFRDNSIPGDLAFYYNEADNTIGNDVDTTSMVGFISPDQWDSYLLEVVLRSKSDWQNDPVGLVIAYTIDSDGTAHTLTVHRRLWEAYKSPFGSTMPAAPLTIELDHLTVGEKILRRTFGGLDYAEGQIPTESNCTVPGERPWHRRPWNLAPNGVKIRVQRNGDVITVISTKYNSHTWVDGSQTVIDLNDYPELHRFKKPCSYGFSCTSQDRTYWEAIFRPGGWRRPFWMSEFAGAPQQIEVVLDSTHHAFDPVRDLHPVMLAAAGGKWPSSDIEWLIKIPSGVTLIAANKESPCLSFLGSMQGKVIIENYGTVLGRGGDSLYRSYGTPGGPAIYREGHITLEIINYGIIAGGGGGGGFGDSSAVRPGGGGAPFGLGGRYEEHFGGNGSVDTPGPGSARNSENSGGRGGQYGMAGANGIVDLQDVAHGGAPGNAISGSGPIVWSARGDIRGPVS